ncbi:MAG: TolC family protein [Rhodanobacter sp.]|nr:MAG: TolC family protein [Rhodanobacter sp.]TAM42154.1 MAG: TolC family protein [Rhodanobacter sp.]TAN26755.1 MAG: TolC family protein [Rhodanobacter sp.]
MLLFHFVRRFTTSALAMLLSGVMAVVPLAQAAGAHPEAGPEMSGAWRGVIAGKVPEGTTRVTPGLSADRLVQRVLQRNPSIEAMQAAADAASARIESAGALDDPMVSYVVAPNTAGGPRQGLNQNAQISQKFPWPGTLALRSRMAAAEAESADQQVADLRLRLAALARSVYAQWYYVHRALAINAENTTLVTHLRAVAETAYATGQAPQQDVLQAEVELVRLSNQEIELRRLRHTLRAKINGLQNLDPESDVPAPYDLPREIPLSTEAALQDAALAHYPLLQSLDARIAASSDRVDLAHKNYLPNVTLLAGYNSLMDLPAKRLTVGVAINIPFGGNHRGEVSEANARLHESEAKLADVRNQLLSDLAQTRATAVQAVATIQLYDDKLLPVIRLNMQAAEADYSGGSGTGDFLKLITAQQQYLTAELELARARADFFIQLASLNYQTGGSIWPHLADSRTFKGSTP